VYYLPVWRAMMVRGQLC